LAQLKERGYCADPPPGPWKNLFKTA